ncbi:MAG: oxidoreductase, partial [Flavobacterium sp.]
SMILGDRKESRPIEKVFIGIFKFINPLFMGGMSKYKGIEARDIAKSMVNSAKEFNEKVKILHWEEMTHLLK